MRNFKSYLSDFDSYSSRFGQFKISQRYELYLYFKSESPNFSEDLNEDIFLPYNSIEHKFTSSLRNLFLNFKTFLLRKGEAFVVSYNSDTRLYYLSEHGNEITRDLNYNLIVPGELSMKKSR